jgi:RNAse (barnase) inhibitor barstar
LVEQGRQLRQLIQELGLTEDDPKSLEALWPHLSIVIREACKLEARLRGTTPQALAARAVSDLLQHYKDP